MKVVATSRLLGSLAEPLRVAEEAGIVTVLSTPAFTTGAPLAAETFTETSSKAVSPPLSVTVRRNL